jgi:hemerythrin-like metal-binding protein
MNKTTLWESKMMVGSDIIDNQHKVLFDLIKDLNNAIRTEVNIKVLDVLLRVLRDYAFKHFQTEEEHLLQHADYANHCLEHYALIKRLNTFIHESRNNTIKGKQTPSDFLEYWLCEHIEKFDKPCFAHESITESLSLQFDPIDAFDTIGALDPNSKEKRQHKRIASSDVVDGHIQVLCYNAAKLKSGVADIVNLSTGGLMLSSARVHEIGDLLIVSCKIGRTFKMKEKVKVITARNQMYGVQFISPARETLAFFTELYGSIHMNKSSYIESK